MRSYRVICALLVGILGTAVSGWTQNNGVITGRITDTSSAVIPGVSITATSEQMLGTRTQVSDESGTYRFTLLPPGVYTVKFELPSFRTIVREGIEMSAGFTATINVAMEVATTAETITVVGESPVVDLERATVGATFNASLLSNLPISNQYYEVLSVTPGLQLNVPDVGGSRANQQQTVRSYGTTGQFMIVVDGITTTQETNVMSMYYDNNSMQEYQITELGKSAELKTAGLSVNMVVKSGGNNLHGSLKHDWIHSSFQGNNLTDDLKARNIAYNKMQHFYDTYFDLGGPFKKDKFWWYVSGKQMDMAKNLYGFYKSDGEWLTCGRHGDCTSEPGQGTNVPALFNTTNRNLTAKFTYQINPAHTFTYTGLLFDKWDPQRGTDTTGVYRTDNDTAILYKPIWAQKVQLNSTLSPRMTLETRIGRHMDGPRHEYPKSREMPRVDLTSQMQRGAYCCTGVHQVNVFTRTHVDAVLGLQKELFGGNHNIKLGYTWQYERGLIHYDTYYNHITTEWEGGNFQRPAYIYTYDTPFATDNRIKQQAFFFNDTWNVTRQLTVNLGIRYDRRRGYWPEQGKPGTGPYQEEFVVPAQSFKVFHNPVARLSAVYDLFGNGRTALKFGYAGYSFEPHIQITEPINPTGLVRKRYRWNGTLPEGFPAVPFVPNEADLVSVSGGRDTRLDPNLVLGRTDEYMASVDHEIVRDTLLNFTVVRKRTADALQTYNEAIPWEAYNIPVTFTDPGRDNRVGTDDDQRMTVYGLDRSYIGLSRDVRRNDPSEINNILGYSFSATKRFSSKWQAMSGVDILHYMNGSGATNPNAAINGSQNYWSWQVKALGRYQLPKGFDLSATVRSLKGQPRTRTIRTPALTQGSITVNAEASGSRFLDTYSLLDVQVKKRFQVGERWGAIETDFTLANIFNNGAVLAISNLTGSTYDQVNGLMDPRVFRVGIGYRF